MKAYFLKHCFGSSIKIGNVHIDSLSEDWHKDFEFINKITLNLLQNIDLSNLEGIYRQEISHDYTNPINKSEKEMMNSLTLYIQNFNLKRHKGSSFHYFNILKDLLELFAKNIEYDYCEQCGDQNYDFNINLDKL